VRIAFNYPTQLMPLLVLFREVLDPELRMVCGLLRPGSIAVDVGASIGTFSLCAAKTGAVVHACEPDPQNFLVLEENIAANGLSQNVIAHEVALGAKDGWSSVMPRQRRFLTNVTLAETTSSTTGTRIHSLDQLMPSLGIDRIDVLKVNTAGCEADVLRGSFELFQRQRVGVAAFLDGLVVRPLFDEIRRYSYELGFYEAKGQRFVVVNNSSDLDKLRPGPLNRYVLLKHSSVAIPRAARDGQLSRAEKITELVGR
jgi:FkbM family methyltransferase